MSPDTRNNSGFVPTRYNVAVVALLMLLSALVGELQSLPATLDDACQPDCAFDVLSPVPEAAVEPGIPPELLAQHRLSGDACYYSDFFDGRKTASGEIFRQSLMTAAHRTLPLGTIVEVTSRSTGRTIQVRVNDRGPFGGNFVIDLSRAAARALGVDRARDRHVEVRIVSLPESARKRHGERGAGRRR